jgi:hypothetical protein
MKTHFSFVFLPYIIFGQLLDVANDGSMFNGTNSLVSNNNNNGTMQPPFSNFGGLNNTTFVEIPRNTDNSTNESNNQDLVIDKNTTENINSGINDTNVVSPPSSSTTLLLPTTRPLIQTPNDKEDHGSFSAQAPEIPMKNTEEENGVSLPQIIVGVFFGIGAVLAAGGIFFAKKGRPSHQGNLESSKEMLDRMKSMKRSYLFWNDGEKSHNNTVRSENSFI